jgi:Fe-S oxidoreductase
VGKGVVKKYIYWYHDDCDTRIENKRAQDELLENLKGFR